MLIGAHVRDDDPLAAAAERNAEVVQFFLSDPQGWKAPNPHPQAEQLRNSDLAVFIHAPYVVNVASQNNRIRIPSRKVVAQQAKAAAGEKDVAVMGGAHIGQQYSSAVPLGARDEELHSFATPRGPYARVGW